MQRKPQHGSAQADASRYPVTVVNPQIPDFAVQEEGCRKLVFVRAENLTVPGELAAMFLKFDWMGGVLRSARHIILMADTQRAVPSPFLARCDESTAVVGLPALGSEAGEDAFFVAYRQAIWHMLGRSHGCRVTFYAPEVLSLYEDADLPVGQVDVAVGALVPRGGAALAQAPEAYPARVLADLMAFAQRVREVAHWSERGLHPTYPDDELYVGPNLSVRCDLIEQAAQWGAALLKGCTNAAEFQSVRPDSTRGFAKRRRDGEFGITRLELSRLMN